jgi:hypothetical protein
MQRIQRPRQVVGDDAAPAVPAKQALVGALPADLQRRVQVAPSRILHEEYPNWAGQADAVQGDDVGMAQLVQPLSFLQTNEVVTVLGVSICALLAG